jgi:hypothetical protein
MSEKPALERTGLDSAATYSDDSERARPRSMLVADSQFAGGDLTDAHRSAGVALVTRLAVEGL